MNAPRELITVMQMQCVPTLLEVFLANVMLGSQEMDKHAQVNDMTFLPWVHIAMNITL